MSTLHGFWRGFWTGLVAPVIAGVILVALTADVKAIQRPDAQQFFNSYWSMAVEDPSNAWNLLTDQFKTSRKLTPTSYEKWFGRFDRIEVSGVKATDQKNYFDVNLTYLYKDQRKPVRETVTLGLKCGWSRQHLPLLACGADNMVIFDGTTSTGRAV